MNTFELLPDLFLRAPQYTFQNYHPDRLPEVIATASFRTALQLASPEFYGLLLAKDFVFDKLTDRERHSLYKYYNRMCFRSTPFGSFASFTLLSWDESNTVNLAADDKLILHLLPDNVERRNAVQPFSKDTLLIRNPSLYRINNVWRYYRFLTDEKGKYRFSLQEIDAVRFNNDLLRLLNTGPVAADKLLDWVQANSGATEGDAADYLDYLLADNVLYAPDQGAMIVHETTVPEIVHGKKYYAALERPLEKGGLGDADRRELSAALGFLVQLAPPEGNQELNGFITAFTKRYDRQKVPLLEALDPDRGVPFGNDKASGPGADLLDEMPFEASEQQALPLHWLPAQRLLLNKWSGREAIILTDDDLAAFGSQAGRIFPNTLAVVFRKTAGGLVLEHASGASATQLIGRFSAFSTDVSRLCQKLSDLEASANPGVVFADIGQLSDDHIDNINRRNQIYPYEIPVNVYSLLPQTNQLPPDDLLLSIQDGELILESKKLKKRVIPRLATAYNYQHTGLALFRLLCALSYQKLPAAMTINPGTLLPGLNYYPRIIYGKTVLSLATWRLKRTELNEDNWVDYHGLPRYVSLGETDQQLVADLSDPAERHFLLKCTAGMEIVQLQEYLMPDRSVKKGMDPLAGQFIGFLTHDRAIYRPAVQFKQRKLRIIRSYPLGTDWLYLKIYCTAQAGERLLRDVIEPLLRRHAPQIRSWFFIRYADPDPHLRLRIRVWSAAADTGRLLVAFQSQLRRTGLEDLVADFLADTYRREFERYGPDLIEQAEEVFRAGSDLVLSVINTNEVERFCIGFATARKMMDCFFPEPLRQAAFAAEMTAQYMQEFGAGDKKLKISLDRKYRSLKDDLEVPISADKLLLELKNLADKAAAKSEVIQRELLANLVHMQLNRTFSHSQRRQELLVYHCLQKHLLRPDRAC